MRRFGVGLILRADLRLVWLCAGCIATSAPTEGAGLLSVTVSVTVSPDTRESTVTYKLGKAATAGGTMCSLQRKTLLIQAPSARRGRVS